MFAACKSDPSPTPECGDSNIKIIAKALYGGDPLVLYQAVDYPQGFKVKFSRADFMIKGLKLSGSSGELAYKDSVFILQFTDTEVEKAKLGNAISFDQCDGNFNELKLGVGLNKDLNAKKPSDFPSSHPLANAFYYWDAWKSYIFMKIEGKYDQDGDGNFEGSFVYHIGTDDLYKLITMPISLNAQTGKSNSLELDIDLKDILAAGGEFIDIPKNPSSHNPGDIAIAHKIYDNLSTAITVK